MGFANPKSKDNKEGYKKQKENRFKKTVPVTGIFDVVNTKLQFQTIGANKTEKLRIIVHVLKVVEAKKKDEARAMVGETFGVDIWWHKPPNGDPDGIEDCDYNLIVMQDGKRLAFNGQKLMAMAMANGCSEDFEENIVERDLVGIITGTPYRISIEVESEEYEDKSGNEKIRYSVEVVEAKHLPAQARKRYTDAPDFDKVAGKEEDRMLDAADYSGGKKGKKGKGKGRGKPAKNDDDFGDDDDGDFYDDDLPF